MSEAVFRCQFAAPGMLDSFQRTGHHKGPSPPCGLAGDMLESPIERKQTHLNTILDQYPAERREPLVRAIMKGRVAIYLGASLVSLIAYKMGAIEQLTVTGAVLFIGLALANLFMLYVFFKLLQRHNWQGTYLTISIVTWMVSDLILINWGILITGRENSLVIPFFLSSTFSAAIFLGSRGIWIMTLANLTTFWGILLWLDRALPGSVDWGRAVASPLLVYGAAIFAMNDLAKQLERRGRFLKIDAERQRQIGTLQQVMGRMSDTSAAISRSAGEMNEATHTLLYSVESQNLGIKDLRKADEDWSEANRLAEQNTHHLFERIEENSVRIGQMAHSVADVSREAQQMDEEARTVPGQVSSVWEAAREMTAQSHQADDQVADTLQAIQAAQDSFVEVRSQIGLAERDIARAREESRRGGALASSSLEAMEENSRFMQGMEAQMESMAGQTSRIEEILATIHSITQRTGLLALNASIVAARAGAHGKSFAVVAGEIRALAVSSATGAKMVASILGEIRDTADTAREFAQDGRRKAGGVERAIHEASAALNGIDTSVAAVEKRMAAIGRSVNQAGAHGERIERAGQAILLTNDALRKGAGRQEAGLQAIREAVAGLGDRVRNVSAAVSEQSQSARGLKESMEDMRAMTGKTQQRIEARRDSQQRLKSVLDSLTFSAESSRGITDLINDVVTRLSGLSVELERMLAENRDIINGSAAKPPKKE